MARQVANRVLSNPIVATVIPEDEDHKLMLRLQGYVPSELDEEVWELRLQR